MERDLSWMGEMKIFGETLNWGVYEVIMILYFLQTLL